MYAEKTAKFPYELSRDITGEFLRYGELLCNGIFPLHVLIFSET